MTDKSAAGGKVSTRGDTRASITKQDENTYSISGELDMSSVVGVLRDAAPVLQKESQQLVFDLKDVSRSDSAGLALLVEWQQQAEQKNTHLKFINLPAQMQAIAHASGLENVLPLDD